MTFRTKVNYRKGVFRFLGSNIYLVIGTGLLFVVWGLLFGVCCLGFGGLVFIVCCLLFIVCWNFQPCAPCTFASFARKKKKRFDELERFEHSDMLNHNYIFASAFKHAKLFNT
jgi:hypothetical protein